MSFPVLDQCNSGPNYISTNEAEINLNGTGQQLGLFGVETVNFSQGTFLRWAGGKTKLLPYILPHIPTKFKNYYEPFLGGGAVFFAIAVRVSGCSFLSDLNPDLINVWQVVRDNPEELLEALNHFEGRNTEEEYYEIRSAKPEGPVAKAAWFLYLNQTSWNSLYRVNKRGEFNVPWGDRSFKGFKKAELLSVSQRLSKTFIELQDFREALKTPQYGDFVYLDPPYLPVSDTSKFRGYTKEFFYKDDLVNLAAACKALSEKGVHWMMSNRNTEIVRSLFSFATIHTFTIRRSVAAQNRRNVQPIDSPEALVIGGPEL